VTDPEPAKPDVPTATPPTPAPAEPTGDAIFDALWARVMASWEDDKVHGALLEYALKSERLPDAAGRYRALKDDPEKGARAKRRLDAIVLAATQLMLAMKTPPNVKVPLPITMSAFGVFLFMMMFLVYAFFHRR
jgi:hypothetical protein